MNKIIALLKSQADEAYKEFSQKLIPTKYEILGIRAPIMKDNIKRILRGEFGDSREVLGMLTDNTFEELAISGAIICGEKNLSVDERKKLIEGYVLKIDNWATNDSFVALSKFFKKNPKEYLEFVLDFLSRQGEFEVRYGVIVLMSYYLCDDFFDLVLEKLAEVSHQAYYVKMAVAWAYATALAKNYEKTLMVLKTNKLDRWTHNKTIQKARESFRISPSQKEELKSLKIK